MIDQALEYLQRKSLDGYELYVSQSSLFDVESKDGWPIRHPKLHPVCESCDFFTPSERLRREHLDSLDFDFLFVVLFFFKGKVLPIGYHQAPKRSRGVELSGIG